MKRVTIKDIAAALDLSISTVSRALSGDKNIRSDTKELVAATAYKMGYQRNNNAAMLRTGRTNTIGVLINEMVTPVASRVLDGIQSVLHSNGFNMQLAVSHDDSRTERSNLFRMENAHIDGLIVAPCPNTSNCSEFHRIKESGMPLVFILRSPKFNDIPKVLSNDYAKAYELTEHLIKSGRRRIVHVRGSEVLENFNHIYEGFRDCLRDHNVSDRDCPVISADITLSEGQNIAERLLMENVNFDAVFACADILAIGIMNALRRKNVEIPTQVAIAGFSGTPLSHLVFPPLTTAEPPLKEMGCKSAELVLDMIMHPDKEIPDTTILDSVLHLRESTGAC